MSDLVDKGPIDFPIQISARSDGRTNAWRRASEGQSSFTIRGAGLRRGLVKGELPASLSRLAAKGTKEVAWSPEAPRPQPESWSVLFSKSFMHDFYDNHNMWVLADHQSADPFLAFKSSSRLMYFKGGWGWHNIIDWLIICRI